MTQRFHMLVAVDFSDCSRAALQHALVLADRLDARLHVQHVTRVPIGSRPAAMAAGIATLPRPDADALLAERTRMLRELVDGNGTERPIEIHSTTGDPAGEVARLAHVLQADMIVVGTHGRTGFQRLLRGSVAESIVRSATRPVLAVPLSSIT